MLSKDSLYMGSTLICPIEKDNVGKRAIDCMEDILQQGLHEEAFAAANNSTELT
jgi:hypothetical protein